MALLPTRSPKYSSVLLACAGFIIASVTPSLAFAQQAGVKPAGYTDGSGSRLTGSTGTKPNFERDVAPILNAKCVACHGSGTKAKGLDLSTLFGLRKGGDSGPVVVSGKPEESLLVKMVANGSMPQGGKQLAQTEVALIGEWIKQGTASAVTFEDNVEPILTANCVKCHGPELMTKSMNLATFAGVIKGSESGTVIVPGNPEASLLFQKVSAGAMPKGAQPLSSQEMAVIREWIEAGAPSTSGVSPAAEVRLTSTDIAPIVLLRCAVCHGLRRQEGGLDLHTREGMLKGGESGPALVPGKPDESLIIRKIRSGEMPPKKRLREVSIKPITPAETEKLVKWIASGAPEGISADLGAPASDPLVSDNDRNFWAFQRPKQPPLPLVKHVELMRNPIDNFVLSKLESKGLTFSPEADKLTLVRRVYYDLTGLPPNPEEATAFLADKDPHAYENLVDRLLASPEYGEHWARYWLDLAGYTDSEGKQALDLPRPSAWRYRDYVIRSFNENKPYDRFLLEQIAGDELADWQHAPVITRQMMDNLVATGFLRMAPDPTVDPDANYAMDRLDVLADELDVLGGGVMGLTIKCAKCHSHKYDPIPQRDYYRLVAIFQGAYDYNDWMVPQDLKDTDAIRSPERFLPYITPGVTPGELIEEQQSRDTLNAALDQKIELLRKALDQKAQPIKKKISDERLTKLPQAVGEDLRKAMDTQPADQTAVQKYLLQRFETLIKIKPEELKQADPAYRQLAEETDRNIKLLEAEKAPKATIQALWDRGDPSPTYLLRRGEAENPGELVAPGVPSVLTSGKAPFIVKPPWLGAHSTGRRLALAKWLVQAENPLTARVEVNRLWARHFGQGIVKTLGNFGHAGALPTNQELLDWLSTEFVSQGWNIKAIQRLIVTSATYRQQSLVTPESEKADPSGDLLSRMRMKRMEAEQLYDTLLKISGKLATARYGPPEPVFVRDDGLVTPIWTAAGGRRSIYVMQRRTEIPTLLDNFDLPQMSPACLDRVDSTVALQALDLMNDGMIYRLAAAFAERVRKEAGDDAPKEIETAYWLALSRPPTEVEKAVALGSLRRFQSIANQGQTAELKANGQPTVAVDISLTPTPLAEVCHALINSAAFLYID